MLGFLQKPAVQLTLFITAVGAAGAFFYLRDNRRTDSAQTKPPPAGMGQAAVEKVTVGRRDLKGSETVETNRLDKLVLPTLKPEPPTLVREKEKPVEKAAPKSPTFPELVQVRASESLKPFHVEPPKVFAPRGTLIRAALVITLESNAIGTPVLAMVTEDVYFQGNLIVPAGTQVQAASAGGISAKFRDRIDIRGSFTFVWADGSEYVINGIALDHEPLADGTFALTDGSPGIHGRIIKTDDYAELKLMVSEALQGYAKTQQSSFNSIYGIVPENTTENARLGAGIGGAAAYSNILVKKMEKDTEYVQVPAGTSFYIYTLDVFEPELRSIGGLRQGNTARSGFELQQEHYTQMAMELMQRTDQSKMQQEESRIVGAAAAARQQSLIDRAKALIGPAQPGTVRGASAVPVPVKATVPVQTKP